MHCSQKALKEYEEHLTCAQTERAVYRDACMLSRNNIKSSLVNSTVPTTVHYSFDFAQQYHFPNNPLSTRTHVFSNS